jgi:uncharacterized protein YjbI with pentapeptide repeats
MIIGESKLGSTEVVEHERGFSQGFGPKSPGQQFGKILAVFDSFSSLGPNEARDLTASGPLTPGMLGGDLNLKGSRFGSDPLEGDFSRARFDHCVLVKTELSNAVIDGAIFRGPRGIKDRPYELRQAELVDVAFPKAMNGTKFSNLVFSEQTDLSKRVLQSCIIEDCYLVRADLRGISISGANARVSNTDLSWANLEGAKIVADLRGSNLSGSNLNDADLTGCNLQGCNLTDASLSNARLPQRLDGVILSSAQQHALGKQGYDVSNTVTAKEAVLPTPPVQPRRDSGDHSKHKPPPIIAAAVERLGDASYDHANFIRALDCLLVKDEVLAFYRQSPGSPINHLHLTLAYRLSDTTALVRFVDDEREVTGYFDNVTFLVDSVAGTVEIVEHRSIGPQGQGLGVSVPFLGQNLETLLTLQGAIPNSGWGHSVGQLNLRTGELTTTPAHEFIREFEEACLEAVIAFRDRG